LVKYYNLCDLFVMPSRQMPGRLDLIEGFGIAFLEAAACGKPVIAGNSGGVADAVLHEQTGLLVDPLSAEAVADAVQRLHRDPEHARRLGQGGRRRCEDELNWPNVASTLRTRLTQVRAM
jgi:phosphatidylinositol alpha-1,6-mannosyltransferase